MWAVPQQHLPLHAGLHWRHPGLPRLWWLQWKYFNIGWTATAVSFHPYAMRVCRMCHIGPGDERRDGGDGDAGSGRLSKSDQYRWKMGKVFDTLKFHLVVCTQIIQSKGSYSFPLCGMIIACLGFILFIGLLLFHRMHRNYLTGMVRSMLFFFFILFFFYPCSILIPSPPLNLYLRPDRNIQKVCHGGGTGRRAEGICQNGRERGRH